MRFADRQRICSVELCRVRLDAPARLAWSTRDVEPDLELEAWTVPSLRPAEDDGPKCPICGGPLIFQSFQRIRPPPLNLRDPRPRRAPEHSF